MSTERAVSPDVRAGRRQAPARLTRPRREPLSADAIVRAALAIADADGVEAVSMRRLATQLSVGTMSLYHHVADKDELLDLMSDAVAGELVVPGGLPGHWRDALRAIAHRTYDAFMRHPWLVDTTGMRPVASPNQLRHIEQSIAAIRELDVDERTAVAMVMATDDYTFGHVRRRLKFGDAEPLGGEDTRARIRELLATGEFPILAAVLDERPDLRPDDHDTFDIGLEWLFDGMAATLGG
jgi:AcrR family transcriptional regulator